ncbi:NAD(P)H-dependent oxidoreductase [Pseudomonas silesiensis]|jgi:NAD(P)H dehydrogenase (quinone)
MNVLTVFSHPFADKYPAAIMNAFHAPFLEAVHHIDTLDLHREDFDPRFTAEDHAHFWGSNVPEEIASMHRRVEKAVRLAFVFPVYWWSMTAMMKEGLNGYSPGNSATVLVIGAIARLRPC